MSELREAAGRLNMHDPPRRAWTATAVAVAIVVLLTLLDASWEEELSATVVVGPFLTALFAGSRLTLAVAVLAVASALLSGAWNDNFGEADYVVRAAVTTLGSAFAVLAARTREAAAGAQVLGAQLNAAMDNLAEAVIVQGPDRHFVYANDAAARTLGYDSTDEVYATPYPQVLGRADYFHEDGSPLRPEDYPSRRVVAGEDPEPMTTRVVMHATGEERWRVNTARGVRDESGRTQLVVTVIEDITEEKRAELGQRLLSRAGEVLASSLHYQSTLQEVAELAVPELADWCGVSMPGRQGYIDSVAVAHSDPEKVAFARSYGERYPQRISDPQGAAQVLRDGRSQLIPEIPEQLLDDAVEDPEQRELLRSIGMRSAIVVPMTAASGAPIGVITFVNAESGRVFTENDVELCEELGRRAGIAVENARLYTERTLIAHTLQRALLPPALPDIPDFSLSALYRPAGEENWVGGDFYDAFPVRGGGWVVAVGDVAGRGAQAASLTAFARHVFRTAAQLHDDPLDAVHFLNRQLYDRPGQALVTLCCVLLRPRGDDADATVVCAGHPLPYVVRQAAAAEGVGRWGAMLGAWPEAEWTRTPTTVSPGDVLVLYTDGVTDATSGSERFGDERLRATLANASDAEDALRRIADGLADFESGEQADDTAALAIARKQPAARAVAADQLGSAA